VVEKNRRAGKVLNPLSPVEAMELLIDKLSKTKANSEFLSNELAVDGYFASRRTQRISTAASELVVRRSGVYQSAFVSATIAPSGFWVNSSK
jgi:hypothetical protein